MTSRGKQDESARMPSVLRCSWCCYRHPPMPRAGRTDTKCRTDAPRAVRTVETPGGPRQLCELHAVAAERGGRWDAFDTRWGLPGAALPPSDPERPATKGPVPQVPSRDAAPRAVRDPADAAVFP